MPKRGVFIRTAALLALLAVPAAAQQAVTITVPDSGSIGADLYGSGDRGLLLVGHGGYSTRATWAPQARLLADAGFRVLVMETRAAVTLREGKEVDCLYSAPCMALDILAAVRHLRLTGVKSVAVIGGSAGGGAAAEASFGGKQGEIDKLVLLAPMTIAAPEKISGRKLFITARNDIGGDDKPRLPGIRDQYEKARAPKKVVILEGFAHGQRMFDAPEGAQLMREILKFLREP
jgi:pimeloyl-ACP methyl ester carboxylesterase